MSGELKLRLRSASRAHFGAPHALGEALGEIVILDPLIWREGPMHADFIQLATAADLLSMRDAPVRAAGLGN